MSISSITSFFSWPFSKTEPPSQEKPPLSIFQPLPLLPGMSNMVIGPMEMKETFFALIRSIRIGDVSTRNSAFLHLLSGLISTGQALISLGQWGLSFFSIPLSWGLVTLILSASCNAFALSICTIEALLESFNATLEFIFLQQPFFRGKEFSSLPLSKNPMERLNHFIEKMKNNRKQFKEFLGDEKVNEFLSHLESFKKQAATSGKSSFLSSNPAFEKMNGEISAFFLNYFYKRYFTYSPEEQHQMKALQSQIDFLKEYKSINPFVREIPDLKFLLDHHSHSEDAFFEEKNLKVDAFIDYISTKKTLIENRLKITQTSLAKRLSPDLVQNLEKTLPSLIEDFSSRNMQTQKKALLQTESLFSTLEIQASKKLVLHVLGVLSIVISLIGFSLIFVPGLNAAIPLILITLGFVISMAQWVFERCILNEMGWQCDLKKLIPNFITHWFSQEEKPPVGALKV
jgi:hypothetical protein